MKIRILIAGLLSAGLTGLTGCAGSPPETTYYLLRADAAPSVNLTESDVGIGRIEVPKYIDQPGIVLETSPNELRYARNNVWAEPLIMSLRSTLAAQLSVASGARVQDNPSRQSSWRLKVAVKIDQLHGTHDGRALLVASWWISEVKGGEMVARGRFESSEALSDSGYPALVAGEVSLLDAMSGEIARAIPAAETD